MTPEDREAMYDQLRRRGRCVLLFPAQAKPQPKDVTWEDVDRKLLNKEAT